MDRAICEHVGKVSGSSRTWVTLAREEDPIEHRFITQQAFDPFDLKRLVPISSSVDKQRTCGACDHDDV
jgi:hypothetical protein